MRTLFMAASTGLLVAACAGSSPPTVTATSASEPSKLNDVQLECRLQKIADLGVANSALGSTCNGSTMSITLHLFDLGSLEGFWQAEDEGIATARLCICNAVICSDKTKNFVIDHVKKVFVDDSGKRMNRGASETLQRFAQHSCLDASAAAMIYQSGFFCGHIAGARSELLRAEVRKNFQQGIDGDAAKIDAKADECFDSMTKSERSR